MNASNGSWGVLVSNNNGNYLPLPSGLVAGNGYSFKMDMRIEAGSPNSTIGGLKLEWQGAGDTGDIRLPYLGAGWRTYTFDRIIPAGATGYKVVPLWGNNSIVGFDNIGFESVPYFVAPPPPPPPSDVIVQEFFPVASPKWGAPVLGGNAITGSSTWSSTEGNPPGATILAAANPNGGGANASFTYTATGVNFGTGPVVISFDGKLLDGLPGTAIHVRYNGIFVGAIQGSFNNTTYSTFTRQFNLNQGFEATTTFNLTFEIALGATAGSSGTIAIDNIIVKTNLPPSATPFAANIKSGKMVSWVAANPLNAYQPQSSQDGVIFNNLGPLVIGNAVTSAFDTPGSPFYQVRQNIPFTQDVVYNGGFVEGDSLNGGYGWGGFQSQPPTWLTTGGRGDNGFCMQISADNVPLGAGPNGSELQQNTRNAFDFETGDPVPGTVTPGLSYKLEFWVKQIGAGIGYVQNFNLQMLGPGNVGFIVGTQNFTCIGPIGVWTKFSTELVAPPGAASAFVQIVGSTGTDATGFGSALIDDVSVVATGYTPDPVPLAATSAASVEISWLAALGRNYQVQSSLGLTSWGNFGTPVAGDGSILAVYDAMVDPKKFYRVARLP